jgi:hypothetical protein
MGARMTPFAPGSSDGAHSQALTAVTVLSVGCRQQAPAVPRRHQRTRVSENACLRTPKAAHMLPALASARAGCDRCDPPAACGVPFAGAAQTRGAVPPHHTNDALETAHAFPDALVVPLHYEGWAHFRQGRADLEAAFKALGVDSRLRLLEPGVATVIGVK